MDDDTGPAWAELLSGWPLWPTGGGQSATMLARYVSARHVDQLGIVHTGGDYAARRRDPVAENEKIVEELYQAVQRRGYAYDVEPYRLALLAGQHILHPTDVDSRGAGTCVDLAVFFSSLLLQAQVAPILAVGWPDAETVPHVWVVAALDRPPNALLEGQSEDPPPQFDGNHDLSDPSTRAWFDRKLHDGHFLAIDIAAVARNYDRGADRDFAQAKQWGLENMALAGVWAADVPPRHAVEDVYPGLPPDRRPPIRRLLPPRTPVDDARRSGSIEESSEVDAQVEALLARRGRVAILGESGMGKSTLALDIAARAFGGSGWFVNGSSVDELLESLARAEAIHGYGSDENLVPAQHRQLAAAAKGRLAGSPLPWVIVVDNADLRDGRAPAELLDLVPEPDPERGQMVIVTSTSTEEWKHHVDRHIVLGRLESDDLPDAVDKALAIRGRPLFITAFRRLAGALAADVVDLPLRLEEWVRSDDAAAILWRAFLHEVDGHPDSIRLARMAAWCPPERIEVAALLDGAGCEEQRFDDLVAVGLLEQDGSRTARMHRLIGEAIRRQTMAEEGPEEAGDLIGALLQSDQPIDIVTFELIESDLTDLTEPGQAEVAEHSVAVALSELGIRAEIMRVRFAIASTSARLVWAICSRSCRLMRYHLSIC